MYGIYMIYLTSHHILFNNIVSVIVLNRVVTVSAKAYTIIKYIKSSDFIVVGVYINWYTAKFI